MYNLKLFKGILHTSLLINSLHLPFRPIKLAFDLAFQVEIGRDDWTMAEVIYPPLSNVS